MLKWLIAAILALILISGSTLGGEVLGGGDSSGGSDSGPSVSPGGGGGGGSRQIDIEKLIKTVKDAEKKKPAKFEELRTLLWKDPITSEEYQMPTVFMYYKGNNTTVSRNQPLEIVTVATNNNPLEMRRMLDLYLEVKEPGSDKYERINSWPEKIQTNEYDEKTNTTYRIWGMLPSFAYLKNVGVVKVRANVSDGVNKWSTAGYTGLKPPYYSELVFNVTNIPSEIRNATVVGIDKSIPGKAMRYTEPITYEAEVYDPDGDLLNITLHVLDDKGDYRKNITQQAKGGSDLTIKEGDWGIFGESDAGHNFTYYFTFDDGIVSNHTGIFLGPSIKNTPKLKVSDIKVIPESANNYWWQMYDFNLKVSNQNPEPTDVTVTLFTNTPTQQNKLIKNEVVTLTSVPQVIQFAEWPFSVSDAGNKFSYYFTFSEDVQGQDGRVVKGEKELTLSSRIVRYDIFSWPGLNVILLLLLSLMVGIFIERRLFR